MPASMGSLGAEGLGVMQIPPVSVEKSEKGILLTHWPLRYVYVILSAILLV